MSWWTPWKPRGRPLLRRKGVQLVIGRYEDSAVHRDRSLEAPHQRHLLARTSSRKQEIAGLAIERVKSIAGLRADGPDHRIGGAIRGGDDRGAPTLIVGAPGDVNGRWRGGADLQRNQVARQARTAKSLTTGREDHVGAGSGGVGSRGIDDRSCG